MRNQIFGSGLGEEEEKEGGERYGGTNDCILRASNTKRAFRMFPFESSAISRNASTSIPNPCCFAT